MHDSRGMIYSTALHGILLVLLIFGLPSFFNRTPMDMEPEVVSIDVLPIAPMSNVKPQEEAKKEKVAKEETAPKPRPETHEREKPKEVPVPVPAPPKPKEHEKPKPKKEHEKQKPKQKSDPLKSIFEGVEKAAAKEGPKTEKSTTNTSHKQAKSQYYDPGAPLSMSEKDAIIQQINDKWNAPMGAKNASSLVVPLHVEVDRDGTVTKVEFNGDKGRYGSDSFYRAAVDAAIRAVYRASPFKNLPAEKYNVMDGWREMDLTFHPPDT